MVADANGIVSIALARAFEAIKLVSEVAQKENSIKVEILAGRTIFEIFNLGRNVTNV